MLNLNLQSCDETRGQNLDFKSCILVVVVGYSLSLCMFRIMPDNVLQTADIHVKHNDSKKLEYSLSKSRGKTRY